LSKNYDIDEVILFTRFGKIPILAKEELAKTTGLQKVLTKIHLNNKLTDAQKETFFNSIERTYKEFIDSLD
jgi:hypothetical protein